MGPFDPHPNLFAAALFAAQCRREPLLLPMMLAHLEARVCQGAVDVREAFEWSALDMQHDAWWFYNASRGAVQAGGMLPC